MKARTIARCAAALCLVSCATATHDPVCAASRSLDGTCPGVFPQIGGDLLFILAAPDDYSGRLADAPEDALRSSILDMLPHAKSEAVSDLIARARELARLDSPSEIYLPGCEHLPPDADPASVARIRSRGVLATLVLGDPKPRRRLLPFGLASDQRSAVVILVDVRSGGGTYHFFALERPTVRAEWQVAEHAEYWTYN